MTEQIMIISTEPYRTNSKPDHLHSKARFITRHQIITKEEEISLQLNLSPPFYYLQHWKITKVDISKDHSSTTTGNVHSGCLLSGPGSSEQEHCFPLQFCNSPHLNWIMTWIIFLAIKSEICSLQGKANLMYVFCLFQMIYTNKMLPAIQKRKNCKKQTREAGIILVNYTVMCFAMLEKG